MNTVREAVRLVAKSRPMNCPKCGSERVEIRLHSDRGNNGWIGYCNRCKAKLTELHSDPLKAAESLVGECKER